MNSHWTFPAHEFIAEGIQRSLGRWESSSAETVPSAMFHSPRNYQLPKSRNPIPKFVELFYPLPTPNSPVRGGYHSLVLWELLWGWRFFARFFPGGGVHPGLKPRTMNSARLKPGFTEGSILSSRPRPTPPGRAALALALAKRGKRGPAFLVVGDLSLRRANFFSCSYQVLTHNKYDIYHGGSLQYFADQRNPKKSYTT